MASTQHQPQHQTQHQELLKQAIEAHLQGQLGQAEDLYRSVLDADQTNPVLYANLGTLCLSTGRYPEAIDLLKQSLVLKPDYALALNSLGIVWQQQQDWEQALRCYQQALDLQPNYPDAWNNYGNLLYQRGRFGEAIDSFEKALRYKNDYPEAWFNLGNALRGLNRIPEAIAAYRTVLTLQPQSHATLNNLGTLLQQRGNLIQAEQYYRQALEFCPDFVEAYSNLAHVLVQSQQVEAAIETWQKLLTLLEKRSHEFRTSPIYSNTVQQLGGLLEDSGRREEAIVLYQKGLDWQPDNPDFAYRLGGVLQHLGRMGEALAYYQQCVALRPEWGEAWLRLGESGVAHHQFTLAIDAYEQALALQPQTPQVWYTLGCLYHQRGEWRAAKDCYHRTLYSDFNHGDAQFNLALLLLLEGEYHTGWQAYEYRFRKTNPVPLAFPLGVSAWQETFPVVGTLWVMSEPGWAEMLLCLRYGVALKARGVQTLVLLAPPEWVGVLSTAPGYDRVFAWNTLVPPELPTPHVGVSLQSLPRIFATRLETIPTPIPYLFADAGLVECDPEEIRSLPGLKVGIATHPLWHKSLDPSNLGQSHHPPIRPEIRPCTLQDLAPLAPYAQGSSQISPGASPETTAKTTAEISLVSLDPREVVASLDPSPWQECLYTPTAIETGELEDVVAIVSQLDLVITADSALAHLVGALGKPVWVILPCNASWPWLQGRSDSPWYPTVRLFRQSTPGEWSSVVVAIAAALRSSQPASPQVSPVRTPRIVVSLGELLDKITILEIRQQHLKTPQNYPFLQYQLEACYQQLENLDVSEEILHPYKTELISVNRSLWKFKHQIRLLIKAKTYDEKFIKVSQAIYRYSDRRAFLKQKINEVFSSEIKEIRLYPKI